MQRADKIQWKLRFGKMLDLNMVPIGAISPGMMAPVTPLAEAPSDDDVDIPATFYKHASKLLL